jgi:hypothetical protein
MQTGLALWAQIAWWDWLRTLLGAAGGTAIVQGLFLIYRDHRQRKSHAAYMAMRLAVTLEAYSAACLDLIERNGSEEPHPEGRFTGNHLLPVVEPYPDDAEGWRAIDRKLAGRCLGLPLKIHADQVSIGWIGTYDEDEWDNAGSFINEKAAGCGLDAWELAKALRHKHKIETADSALNHADEFNEILKRAQRLRTEEDQGRMTAQAPLKG